MTKISTREALPPVLDWLVAKCQNQEVVFSKGVLRYPPGQFSLEEVYSPSTDPAQGWEIIDKDDISVFGIEHGLNSFMTYGATLKLLGASPLRTKSGEDCGRIFYVYNIDAVTGPTKLIAAMRAKALRHLGEEVEVPEELVCSE
jgi:hypothetical protein